jgi:formate C-acetyltransferase
MNERITKLRKASLEAQTEISSERAELLTDFYGQAEGLGLSPVLLRGKAVRYLFEHKALYLGDGELIVGERGPHPKATPTYPEICTHTVRDLETLDRRPKVGYRVADKVYGAYRRSIIPFWQNRSMRGKIFSSVSREWKKAYEAGVFTEFQEQRAPGHTVCGEKIYREGFGDWIGQMEKKIETLQYASDREALQKREQWLGMIEAARGMVAFAERYADLLRQESRDCPEAERRAELAAMAEICTRVPRQAPRTFWEALQMYWFVHLGVITEFNTWDSFNPGRLDQHLITFYRRDLAAGVLTRERAKELLMAFWVKFNNQPAPPKVGVTAEESSTYTDFCLINVGGVTPDGEDASNELSELILEVIGEMRLLQPSSMVQISKKNPDKLVFDALNVIRKGFGQPSLFNSDTIVSQLVRQGKSLQDARQGGASGCVESGAFGREAYFLSGYMNLPKILEITLHGGVDPSTGKRMGCKTADPVTFRNMGDLIEAFGAQINHFTRIKIEGNNLIEQLYAAFMPAPYMSLVIDDCIEKGRDYHAGGARYNTTYIQGVGLGTVVDSLAALNEHVFVQGRISMKDYLACLEQNFTGCDLFLKELIDNTPKYGNDDLRADVFVKTLFELYFRAVDGKANSRGGVHRINLLPTTVHVYFGKKVGATPDGRLALTPLSEGVSPVQGADRHGPTAVIKSAARIDHLRTGGTLLNQKFTPDLLGKEENLGKMVQLVRSYFRMDGHHIQFNVVDAGTLRDAQKNPQLYRDLIVRVAGYSDYFNDLSPDLQEEIIRRTEHGAF